MTTISMILHNDCCELTEIRITI